MYSPKIPDHLIPPLYWLARSRSQPMTQLVAEIVEAYLAAQDVAAPDADLGQPRSLSEQPG